jgi:hypothetical protein
MRAFVNTSKTVPTLAMPRKCHVKKMTGTGLEKVLVSRMPKATIPRCFLGETTQKKDQNSEESS